MFQNKVNPKDIPPACPECEKLSAVSKQSNEIGNFLEWLSSKGFVIAGYEHQGGRKWETLVAVRRFQGSSGINQLLARYFDIDLDKVEQERRALLDWVRSQQEENDDN